MSVIYPIVEGHGDVSAVPVLVRRIAVERLKLPAPRILPAFRLPRTQFESARFLDAIELAARKVRNQVAAGGGVLVVLDSDKDLPCELGPRLLHRASSRRPDLAIRVVLACREFEAWFLAAAESLRGLSTIRSDALAPEAPEAIAGAKERLQQTLLRPGCRYNETIDQQVLARKISLEQAATCPSFDKLCRDVAALLRV